MSANKSLTNQLNNTNIASVRKGIHMKTRYVPHFATINDTETVVTDMDHFPYTRFYRGVPHSSQPVVMEREAGWRPHRAPCYSVNQCNKESDYPNHCFEAACSTVYPCYPQYLQKFSDRDALNVQLNRACIVQYR